MDKHTFIGKRKVGSTDICDFTDYQGIGHDPLYKRYESVFSIVRRHITSQFIHFLAAPDYSPEEDLINWYIEQWVETPETLSSLHGDKKEKYTRIKAQTIAHYKEVLNSLSGEELQVMASTLRYIDDDFIFCCDGKIYLVAWGMTPDSNKHQIKGELVHGAPSLAKYKVNFDAGEHGKLNQKSIGQVILPEGIEISGNDVPQVVANQGYAFTGWDVNPVGIKLDSDMTFVAQYKQVPPPSAVSPTPTTPPQPAKATCRFDAGQNGQIIGNPIVVKTVGSRILSTDIPGVRPDNGYSFIGWSSNPLDSLVKGDLVFTAQYVQQIPWYKKIWMWFTGNGCLKWILWSLLALLFIFLLSWLLRGCHSCSRATNGVVEAPRIVTADGDTLVDNGTSHPIDLHNGSLPPDQAIVAPIREGDGTIAPIEKEPGFPPIVANRLFLFLENEDDNIDAFAADFKKAYPGNQYTIIGYDREVKSLLIQIPESERDHIRRTINSKIPNHRFIVFDEEIYELNGHPSASSTTTPGWHLKAVKAQAGWEITKGSPEVIVAVIDDGIDASHPMFNGRIVNPYNVYTQNNNLSSGDGHGTHTAGLAVGSLDYLDRGAAGIAPGCKLMPVQVIDNNLCPLSALISGIMYAVHKGADVVNMSIGPSFQGLNGLPIEMQNQIAQTQFKNVEKLWNRVCKLAAAKNTILVFAAGNDDILSSIPPENRSSVAITVGAVDQKLYPTEFTNFGPCTDISAPGKEIYSSYPGKDFRSCDGTSMAAPIVACTVALMKSLKKDLTVEQANNVLYKTGLDVYGNMPPMVQVNLALEAVRRGDFSTPPPRQIRPVPAEVAGGSAGDTPASWTEPVVEEIINDNGAAPIAVAPGIDTPAPTPVAIGNVPSPDAGTDYDAIRRLIQIYKQKISELEGQLPENKKHE